MKKFKCTWEERISERDGFNDEVSHHFAQRSTIIEAESEDLAYAIWANGYGNENTNGLEDCIEIVDHPLLSKMLFVDMPDGITYGVPVELIARHRAEYYAHKSYNGDITNSLLDDTIPLFESNEFEIRDWASNNMNWKDVKNQAVMLTKKVPECDYEDAWCNGEWKIS